MGTVLFNSTLAAKARLATYRGRQYLVAPISSIVPGVLNGSKGALYYPPHEVSANPAKWDGMPLTVYHPILNGEHVSAQTPGVWDKQGIGFTRQSIYNGKLQHMGWFDVERTKQIDRRVYEALLAGQPMEISTGLFTDNIPQRGTSPDGRPYEYVAVNYRPDHVAILPDQVGACSVNDGCGLNVNSGDGSSGFDSDEQRQAFFGLKGGNESKKGESKSSEPSGPWHGSREEVFSAMRNLGKQADYHWDQAKKLGPRGGSLSVGSADFDHTLKATVHDAYLRKLRQGGTPAEAHKAAAEEGTDTVKKWNERGSKGRVSIGGSHELKRWEGAGQSEADTVHHRFLNSLPSHVKPTANRELVNNPFKSEAQRRACYAANDPNWDCDEWEKATPRGKLPEKAATRNQLVCNETSRSFWRRVGEAFGLVANMPPQRGPMGRFGQGPDEQALERGESDDELDEEQEEEDRGKGKGKPADNADPANPAKPPRVSHAGAGSAEARTRAEQQRTSMQAAAAPPATPAPAPATNALGTGNWSLGKRSEHANNLTAQADKLTEGVGEDNTNHRLAKLAHDDAAEAHWDAYKEASSPAATKSIPDYAQAGFHHQKAKYHEGKAEEHAKECGEEYGGEQVGNAAMTPHHQASKDACHASMDTENEECSRQGQNALSYSKAGDSENAGDAHKEAAGAHEDAATDARKAGDTSGTADKHDQAAALHRKAASLHDANFAGASKMVGNDTATENREFASDDERKAAFAAMAESGSSKSEAASKASKSANRKGSSESHKAAASAHKAAAAHHAASGNTKLAKAHRAAAREHSSKAKSTNNEATVYNRQQALSVLSTNCSCERDKVALNALSDDLLRVLIANEPKAQGSNAGRIADSKTDAQQSKKQDEEDGDYTGGGGEKFDREDPNADDDEDLVKGGKGFTGNQRMTMEQWLGLMPVEARPVWNRMSKAANRDRQLLINRLTAHLPEGVQQQAVHALSKRRTEDLEFMANLLPVANQEPVYEPDPLFLGAAAPFNAGPAVNVGSQDDVLDLPTLNYADLKEEMKAKRA